jgi:hypothetical protein
LQLEREPLQPLTVFYVYRFAPPILRLSVAPPASSQRFFDHIPDKPSQGTIRVKFWLQNIENIHLSGV